MSRIPKTMQETAHLRRLTAFNYLLLCIVVLGAMLYVANSKLTNFRRDFEKVHVRWEVDGSITFSSSSDGPFIISHLFMFPSGPNEPDSIAQLPRPIVIVESGAVSLTKAEVDKLIWYQRRTRERVAAPAKGAPIKALYCKALRTAQAQ
jgi:hypothetical protein